MGHEILWPRGRCVMKSLDLRVVQGNVIKSVTKITESGVGIKTNRLIGNMRGCKTGWQGLLWLSGGF